MKGHLKASLLGALASLAVVSTVAVASNVTIPNTFSSNTVIKAADVNANFSAVATANNDNQTQINNIYTKPQSDARFARMANCYWIYNGCGAAGGTMCTAKCNSGSYVVAGGCDGNGAAPSKLVKSYPGPSSGNYGTSGTTWPFGQVLAGTTNSVIDQWTCQVDTGYLNSTYAFCCPGI
jgi:hypothetical protein